MKISRTVVVGRAYVFSAVSLQEVLVVGGFIGHPLIAVGFTAKIRGWCASEPVRLVAAPDICQGRDMALELQVDAEKQSPLASTGV